MLADNCRYLQIEEGRSGLDSSMNRAILGRRVTDRGEKTEKCGDGQRPG
jgi:hypothetical protein